MRMKLFHVVHSSALLLLFISALDCFRSNAYSLRRIDSSHRWLHSEEASIDQFENEGWRSMNIVVPGGGISHHVFAYPWAAIRGLKPDAAIRKGHQVIRLPVQSCLVAIEDEGGHYANDDMHKSLFKSVKRSTNRLAVLLIDEYNKKEKSRLHRYIDILPSTNSSLAPLQWKDDILESFPYRPVVKDVVVQRKSWFSLYEVIKKSYAEADIEFATIQRFVWSMEMVASRAFQGELSLSYSEASGAGLVASSGWGALGRIGPWSPVIGVLSLVLSCGAYNLSLLSDSAAALLLTFILGATTVPSLLAPKKKVCVLLPAVDSCNHRGRAATCELCLVPVDGCFSVTAATDISATDEITLSYGQRTNDDLLQFFGFVEIDNVHDRYVVVDAPEKIRFLSGRHSWSSDAVRPPGKSESSLLDVHLEETAMDPSTYNCRSSSMMLADLYRNVDIVSAKVGAVDESTDIEVNRGAAGEWKLQSIEGLLPADRAARNRCLILLLLFEKKRLLFHMDCYLSSVEQHSDPITSNCSSKKQVLSLMQVFLQEKVKVLDGAIRELNINF